MIVPLFIGYFNIKASFFLRAYYPIIMSSQALLYWGNPITEGMQAFGSSSSENPALHCDDPLSITTIFPELMKNIIKELFIGSNKRFIKILILSTRTERK